jgi:hypothetical protein
MAILLLSGGAVRAAEPPATAAPDKPPSKQEAPKAPALKLKVGNVRNYMMPHEFKQAVNAPDPDKNTVVVEAERVLLPMKSQQPVPNGIIAPFWAIANPLQAWRVLVPDPKAPPPGPPEVVPPPPFRWGP